MTTERIDALAALEASESTAISKMAVDLRPGETLVLEPPGGDAITIELKHKSGGNARFEVRAARAVRIKRPA